MRPARSLSLSPVPRIALAPVALLGIASTAFAQQVQNLTIGFATLNQAVAQSVPLSSGLTVGIALMLAAFALVVLRRKSARGARLLGWMLAVVAGTMLAFATGQRPISDAQAVNPVTLINLTTSPATLNVGALFPNPGVTVVVTNTTGQTVRIDSITLDMGVYGETAPTTCVVAGVLAPGGQCTITLLASV
jgi:hypothetical protein